MNVCVNARACTSPFVRSASFLHMCITLGSEQYYIVWMFLRICNLGGFTVHGYYVFNFDGNCTVFVEFHSTENKTILYVYFGYNNYYLEKYIDFRDTRYGFVHSTPKNCQLDVKM